MRNADPVLLIQSLSKAFGTVQVLHHIDFQLQPGEVHALVGENGAGKSTLSKIISGLLPPDKGSMALRGTEYAPATKRDAERLGVRMVLQELNLIGNLSVAESMFLSHLPHRCGWIDYAELHRRAERWLKEVGLPDLDPSCPVHSLGIGQQQLVEIAAGIAQRCDILILDEPTAALTEPETARLFANINHLKSAGTAVIYISHRLEEIRRIADRISILRDGVLVATHPCAELSHQEMVRLMVGRDVSDECIPRRTSPGPVALRVNGLRCANVVRDVGFEVHSHEILGFAGLMGSGRTETMRALFGADLRDRGDIYRGASDSPLTIRSPRDAVRAGIALLTENRKEQGLLLPLSVQTNITLNALTSLCRRGGWIRHVDEAAAATPWKDRLSVRCRDIEQRVSELSGGNQQKIVVARWLLRNCDILIFDEPTRGIDVGARYELHRLLGELADRGKAIIVVSSDMQELLAVSDRIAVMSAGRLTATFTRSQWSQHAIMQAALQGYTPETTSPHETGRPTSRSSHA